MAEHSQCERAAVLAGRYQLRRLIARGGMGEVYEAQDRELQRRVAVKVFRSGADERDRFRIEAVTLAGLSHPGLVRVFDAGEHDGDAFVVLELVDGPSLARRLREQGAATPGEAAAIGARVADALAHVHAGGVVHRDVTPSNILCGPDGRPKLADFGIARLIDSARVTAPAMAVGTAAYMAPEQVLGEDVTPAADIYSLGLVLLEMLTGSRAYDGPSREAAVARLVRPPSLPDDLPRGWRRLIQDMTGGDPSSRPSAPEVRDRLRSMGAARQSASPAIPAPSAASFAGMAATAPEAATVAMSAVDATALVPLQSIPGAGTDRHRRIPALALLLVVAALGVAVAGLATLGGGETGRPPSTTSVMAPVVTGPVSMPATAAPPPTEPVGQPIDATPGGASPDGTARTDGEAPSGVEGEGRAKGQGKEKDDKRGPKR
jgi:hypothetical protein